MRLWLVASTGRLLHEARLPEVNPHSGTATTASSFGVCKWITNKVVYQVLEKRNSESSSEFLDHLVQQHSSERPLAQVLETASIHHCLASQHDIAVLVGRLLPVFLQKYCFQLNSIERVWKYLIASACANKLFADMDPLAAPVEDVLHKKNDTPSTSRCILLSTYRDHLSQISPELLQMFRIISVSTNSYY